MSSSYSAAAAREITGVSQRCLDYWSERDIVRPSIQMGTGKGSERLYSFDDLLRLTVVKKLRDAGLSLQRVRKGLEKLRKRWPKKDPLLDEHLVTDGESFYRVNGSQVEDILADRQLGLWRLGGFVLTCAKECCKSKTRTFLLAAADLDRRHSMFWTSQRILQELNREDHTLIDPVPETEEGRKERVKCGAFELAVDCDYYATSMEGGKEVVPSDGQMVIQPGQLALLITREVVHLPKDVVGLISIKFGKKKRGLINVSGFHVDPGFMGKLKFSVYNAGSTPIVLDAGEALFLIWFSSLNEDDIKAYDGNHQHNKQLSVTAEDVTELQGRIASPQELSSRLDDQSAHTDKEFASLRETLSWHRAYWILLLSVFVSVLVIPNLKLLSLANDEQIAQSKSVQEEISDFETRIARHEVRFFRIIRG